MKCFGKITKWLCSGDQRRAKPCPSNFNLFIPPLEMSNWCSAIDKTAHPCSYTEGWVYKASLPSHGLLTPFREVKVWKETGANSKFQKLLPKVKSHLTGEAKPRDEWGRGKKKKAQLEIPKVTVHSTRNMTIYLIPKCHRLSDTPWIL